VLQWIPGNRFIIFLQLFYYFGHIILFSIEPVNMHIFQIFKVLYISSVTLLFWPQYYVQYWTWKHENVYCFSYIIKCNLNIVNKSVFQILEFQHTAQINGNLNIIACYTWFIMKLDRNVSVVYTNLSRNEFTQHGMHLNASGREKSWLYI
jgi:hypothetical protein